MEREVIRVEPRSDLGRVRAPTSPAIRYGDTVYASRFPPFDPETGQIPKPRSSGRSNWCGSRSSSAWKQPGQSSMEQMLKCNVYCTSGEKFARVNTAYTRISQGNPPAHIFINAPAWFGRVDIEIDGIAAVET